MQGLCTVRRFRAGNFATSQVPLSEAAQQIQREKGDSEHIELRGNGKPSQEVVNQEDEQFEWREVIRGKSSP